MIGKSGCRLMNCGAVGFVLSDIFDARCERIGLDPHASRNAISPCGLHCVIARDGAMIIPLLRSFLAAIRIYYALDKRLRGVFLCKLLCFFTQVFTGQSFFLLLKYV